MTAFREPDIAGELQAELQTSLISYDPVLAQHMVDQAIAATLQHGRGRARWAMPLLASGAVAAVVGGVVGVSALGSHGEPAVPGGGPTSVSVPRPVPSTPRCVITAAAPTRRAPRVVHSAPDCEIPGAPTRTPLPSAPPTVHAPVPRASQTLPPSAASTNPEPPVVSTGSAPASAPSVPTRSAPPIAAATAVECPPASPQPAHCLVPVPGRG
jgi:hypothetical protein